MSLKYQILFPMALVTLLTIVALSVYSIAIADRRAMSHVEERIGEIAATLQNSPFPLNEAVLQQVKALTGAELMTVSGTGAKVASTLFEPLQRAPATELAPRLGRVQLNVADAPRTYLASRIRLTRPNVSSAAQDLLVFFPESAYIERRQEALWAPMVVGALSLGAISMLAFVIHRQLSQPLQRLRFQVERIAEGDFQPMPLPHRKDEVHSLAASVNRMAQLLADSERLARQSERARTLGQLGGGLAHHLRNSVTGARMALDLHRDACHEDSDSLDMIQRQLTLMESYLQRFLHIGERTTPFAEVQLNELLSNLAMLVRPRAQHVQVRFDLQLSPQTVAIAGDSSELEQMFLNLMLNAVEAAANDAAAHQGAAPAVAVRMELANESVLIHVDDTGPGPGDAVAAQLFEPFVSNKPEGVGLGLTMSQRAARAHGGEIRWERCRQGNIDITRFSVQLPLQGDLSTRDEAYCGDHTDR